jgi:chemotaxis-related protein WspD
MTEPAVRSDPRAAVDDCWNRIGVRGDRSCPKLVEHVHCRNCPVYSAGAADLLGGEAPAGHLAERTAHFIRPTAPAIGDTRSVVIFRVGAEWLALPSPIVVEVANLLPIHSLPHRTGGVVLGVTSVRGELLVCVSLRAIVGADPIAPKTAADPATAAHAGYSRLLVIRRESIRVVCPVDEVHGIHRFDPRELKPIPTTVSKAAITYSTGLLPWQGRSVGSLDDQLLFYTLQRSLE